MSNNSVLQDWVTELPLQQQTVLMLALRGPDGYEKFHPCKDVVRAIRACVVKAAFYGRALEPSEPGDNFMDMTHISNKLSWEYICVEFNNVLDGLPIHFVQHLGQAANILRKYPNPESGKNIIAQNWTYFYEECYAHYFHLIGESVETMDRRLCDWNRKHWGERGLSSDEIKATTSPDFI